MRILPDVSRLPKATRRGSGLGAALALAVLTGACSSGSPPLTFDLTAPAEPARGRIIGQVLVAEPTAVQALSDQRILVKDQSGAVSALGEGQWADQLPRLVQTRMIQTLENTSGIRAVARANSGIAGDLLLTSEIRSFQVQVPGNEALVEISAKLVSDRDGRVIGGRLFRARVPVARIDAATVAPALDQALSTVLVDVARWISGGSRAAEGRAQARVAQAPPAD
jgi:cholesterol transport system auxiliary component